MARIPETRARRLLNPDILTPEPLRTGFENHAQAAAGLDPLSRTLAMDFRTWLADDILVKVDRMSMAHSLEVRVPLLDTDFVAYVAGLPTEAKLKNGRGKQLFRRALKGRIPNAVLDRPKQGFHLPIDAWLAGPLQRHLQRTRLEPKRTRRRLCRSRHDQQLDRGACRKARRSQHRALVRADARQLPPTWRARLGPGPRRRDEPNRPGFWRPCRDRDPASCLSELRQGRRPDPHRRPCQHRARRQEAHHLVAGSRLQRRRRPKRSCPPRAALGRLQAFRPSGAEQSQAVSPADDRAPSFGTPHL